MIVRECMVVITELHTHTPFPAAASAAHPALPTLREHISASIALFYMLFKAADRSLKDALNASQSVLFLPSIRGAVTF